MVDRPTSVRDAFYRLRRSVFIRFMLRHLHERHQGLGYSIRLENVWYRPPGAPKDILEDIHLKVEPGEFVALVGGNGAGKSTLLRLIAGELPNPPRGDVIVGGVSVWNRGPVRVPRVGVVHQFDSFDLVESLSVAENIAIRQMLAGGHDPLFLATPGWWWSRVQGKLGSRADLGEVDLSRSVRELSGGKRQLLSVAIAMHLEHERNPCKLLLLDEHTSKLDHLNARKVMDFTAEEIERTRTTAVMVTHRYDEALRYCSRIIVVSGGRITDRIARGSEAWSLEEIARCVERPGKGR